VRGVGIEIRDLLEGSRFGQNARRELIRWFPSSPWVGAVDRNPVLREQILAGRRDLLRLLALGTAAPLVASCALLPLIFEAINSAQKVYSIFEAAGGTALFTNNSQSREKAQLLTSLLSGDDEEDGTVEDEQEFLVPVPGGQLDFPYLFDGLVSEVTGNHLISGLALGETKLSEVFDYVA